MTAEREPGTVEYEVNPDGSLGAVRRVPGAPPPRPPAPGEAPPSPDDGEDADLDLLVTDLEAYFAEYSLELLPIRSLAVDHRFQRGVRLPHVRRICQQFDKLKFVVIVATRRPDGVVVILDGQHRWQGLKLRLKSRGLLVPVLLLPWRGLQSAAVTFHATNRDQNRLTTVDSYWAGLRAGHMYAERIREALADIGEYVPMSKEQQASWDGPGPAPDTRGGIRCIEALDKILKDRRGGDGVLQVTIQTARRCFPHEPADAVSATLLYGLFLFLRAYNGTPNFTTERLVTVCRGTLVREVAAQGRGAGNTMGANGAAGIRLGLEALWRKQARRSGWKPLVARRGVVDS